jgi:hypothetical protein
MRFEDILSGKDHGLEAHRKDSADGRRLTNKV